jgi:hypothetical protein
MSYGVTIIQPPATIPSMRAGETDGRYIDCTPDLGPVGDTFAVVPTLTITRTDGVAITSADLQSAGAAWPDTLDATKLITTYGLLAPPGSAGQTYQLTITANTTTLGRVYVRDCLITIAAALG